MPRTVAYEILRYSGGVFRREEDLLVEERRVDIIVGGDRYLSVMATPRQLEHLAVGCLFSEGVIKSAADLAGLEVRGLEVLVDIKGGCPPPPARVRSSGFGLGSAPLADGGPDPAVPDGVTPPAVTAAEIVRLMADFNQQSELFRLTGAVHSCCLVVGGRKYFADDVGRHNALDKVIGQYLAAGPSGEPGLVLTTGRISTEILIKSARAGLGLLVSRSAATDRAVDLARKLNMVLIGFARDQRFNIYHGGEFLG